MGGVSSGKERKRVFGFFSVFFFFEKNFFSFNVYVRKEQGGDINSKEKLLTH